MIRKYRSILMFVAAGWALAGAGTASATIHYSAAEAATVKSYVLTADKVDKYEAANAAIKRDQSHNPALAREVAPRDDDDMSLTQFMTKVKASPVALSYYQKAGLSAADAALLPCALTNAALSQASPEMAKDFPASAAQVAFVKAHHIDLQKLGGD